MNTTSNLSAAVMEAYSKEIMLAAQPSLRYEQFATKKTEFGGPGKTVEFLKYGNLAEGGELAETDDIVAKDMSASQIPLTLKEYGNAVRVSEFLIRTSFDDVMATGAILLGQDYAKVIDKALRTVMLAGSQVVYAGSKTARAQIAAGDAMSTKEIKDVVEVLETNNTPKYAGDSYICFLHPHQGRKLRDDENWINAAHYAGSTQIFLGELGKYEDTRFVSTTQQVILAAAGAGAPAADVYQAVMFGDNAYGLGWGLPVEMRDNGIEDHGRKRSLAWYAIMACGLLNSERLVRIETN